jgi:hypothetical protein
MDSLGNQDVTGPETPPTMPKGTVRVDVSDLYDWYKLGQHISNMKGLGKHDFGQGAPSAIVSFGDEDAWDINMEPYDFNKEYIKVTRTDNHEIIERVKYEQHR